LAILGPFRRLATPRPRGRTGSPPIPSQGCIHSVRGDQVIIHKARPRGVWSRHVIRLRSVEDHLNRRGRLGRPIVTTCRTHRPRGTTNPSAHRVRNVLFPHGRPLICGGCSRRHSISLSAVPARRPACGGTTRPVWLLAVGRQTSESTSLRRRVVSSEAAWERALIVAHTRATTANQSHGRRPFPTRPFGR